MTACTRGSGEETGDEVKEGENASEMRSCLRLEGISEQRRSRQKRFINTGALGRERQSSKSASPSAVKGPLSSDVCVCGGSWCED